MPHVAFYHNCECPPAAGVSAPSQPTWLLRLLQASRPITRLLACPAPCQALWSYVWQCWTRHWRQKPSIG